MRLIQFLHRYHRRSKNIQDTDKSFSSFSSESFSKQLTKPGPTDKISFIDTTIHKINKEGNLEKVEKIEHIKKQKQLNRNGLIGDLNYLGVGYFISTPIVVGVMLGILIDKALKIPNNIYTIIFLIIGALGSIYNIFSLTKQEKK